LWQTDAPGVNVPAPAPPPSRSQAQQLGVQWINFEPDDSNPKTYLKLILDKNRITAAYDSQVDGPGRLSWPVP